MKFENNYLNLITVLILAIGLVVISGCLGGGPTDTTTTTQAQQTTTTQAQQTTTTQAQQTTTTTTGGDNLYTGFMQPEEGSWAEYQVEQEQGPTTIKIKYLGEDTIEGKQCSGMELEGQNPQGDIQVIQTWFTSSDYQPVKLAFKQQGREKIYCMTPDQAPPWLEGVKKGTQETPEKYDPSSPDYSIGTYEIGGETINVAKFKLEDGGEAWVSSEVPLGIVKSIDSGGTVTMELQDFALSGAQRKITEEDLENCQEMATG